MFTLKLSIRPLILLNLLSLFGLAGVVLHANTPYDWALLELEYRRAERVQALEQHTSQIRKLAEQAQKDELLQQVFSVFSDLAHISQQSPDDPPQELVEQINLLEQNFQQHYLANYYRFYNVLFFDLNADVFYSARHSFFPSDLRKYYANAPDSNLLKNALKQNPREQTFVDYQYHEPSGEPAAFIIVPIFEGEALQGWIALQCAINKLNALFSSTQERGKTFESFLVNREGYMLTDSFFTGDSSILKQHLSEHNIGPKFTEGTGFRTVVDYRNKVALTAFEVVKFMDTQWLVVCKQDKAEVETMHYKKHEDYYNEQLQQTLSAYQPPPTTLKPQAYQTQVQRVDMDEFLKVSSEEPIGTWGISTCAGILAICPGQVTYLAHVSTKDKILGGTETDLLGQMLHKMKTFDLYPYQNTDVGFTIVTREPTDALAIAHQIIERGYQWSQINFFIHPPEHVAALYYLPSENILEIQLRASDAGAHYTQAYRPEHCIQAGAVLEAAISKAYQNGDIPIPEQSPALPAQY